MCAMNLAHDLERRNGVGAILTEFRAAEDLEPDMLRQCFAAERVLLDALLSQPRRHHARVRGGAGGAGRLTASVYA
jgi:hypothetical protein